MLQINDVLLEAGDLDLGILQLPEHLKADLVRLVDLLFHDEGQLRRLLQLCLKPSLHLQLMGQFLPETTVFIRQHIVTLLLSDSKSSQLVVLHMQGGVQLFKFAHLNRLLLSELLVLREFRLEGLNLLVETRIDLHSLIQCNARRLQPLNLDVLVLAHDVGLVQLFVDLNVGEQPCLNLRHHDFLR